MNQILFKLEASDIALYEDMCFGNGMTPRITRITKEQTYFLISLRENGITPEISSSGTRLWRIPGKRAQGGKLTQKTAQKFFLSEK